MKVQFVKNQSCIEAGKVVAEIEGELEKITGPIIRICQYEMGDNRNAMIWETLADVYDCFGDEAPAELVAAFGTAQGGVLESSNGCPPEYTPLPAKDSPEYHKAIFDELTSCDWGDCEVIIINETEKETSTAVFIAKVKYVLRDDIAGVNGSSALGDAVELDKAGLIECIENFERDNPRRCDWSKWIVEYDNVYDPDGERVFGND